MNIEINNLTSGLIGAIIGSLIGGIATYFTTIKGAKTSIDAAAKLDADRRARDENNLTDQVLDSLNEELKFNLQLTETARLSSLRIRFIDRAFEFAMTNARVLPEGLIKLLNPVYIEICRFNILAEYDQEKIPFGLGSLDDSLRAQSERIKEAIKKVTPKFEEYYTIRELKN